MERMIESRDIKHMACVERIKQLEEENKNLNKQIEQFKKGVKAGTKIIERLEEENKKLKEEVEQLKNKRIFSSAEYDLITLTSTTPQWELRPRDENGFYKEVKVIC